MQRKDADWFEEIYSEVPADFPPTLTLKKGETVELVFQEKRPRLVIGGYKKRTAVINVLYKDEPRTLFVGSNVDLARQIWKMWKSNRRSLKGVVVRITKIEKRGRNWICDVQRNFYRPK